MTSTFAGPIDLHSHLVPDVDDGARGIEGAMAAVGRMVDVGIRRMITTPHLDASLQEHPEEMDARVAEVAEAFEFLKEGTEIAFPGVELRQGFEVMLDTPEIDWSDPRLRLDGTQFALVEWPRLHIPPGTDRVIGRMLDAGVRPVIAHPERYHGIDQMGAITRQWKDQGALLQVNWGSILGRYGPAARKVALSMLRSGEASYLASDFHAREHLALNFTEARAVFEEVGAIEAFKVLTETNPRRLWEDTPPMPVPLLPEDEGFVAKLRRLLTRS